MKKLPIGSQDLPGLIGDGYLFVDKTEQIHRLMQAGKYLFLSRPRRFGKSLLVSTLHEIFRGNKALFKGLWIEDKIDWAHYQVIRVDFNKMNYQSNPLSVELDKQMEANATANNIRLTATDYKGKFAELLETLGSGDKKAVVLIDEYDKAITDFLGEDEERIPENVRVLKNFYSTLKSLDRCIHFVFITGVSKYGRVSIFSDLNNLNDITTHPDFAVLLGWTQEEMERYFDDRLSDLARHFNLDRADLLEKIRAYYNGYSWDGEHRVYNPYSLLNFFHQPGRLQHETSVFKGGKTKFFTAALYLCGLIPKIILQPVPL
ncbi:MAG: AAA family ATPase, partial [Saprospiraceae bacterium]